MSSVKTMWDERFSADTYMYGTQANDFVVEQAASIPKGKVLCLAEGEGRNAVYLAKRGFTVTAVDFSAVALAKAQQLAKANGVTIETVEADLNSYDLGEQCYQGIVAVFCHLPSCLRQSLHKHIESALTPGGVFLNEAYSKRQLEYGTGGPKDPDLLLELEEFKTDMPLLTFDILHEIERHIEEGELHNGMSAVIQCKARRSEN